MRKVFLSVIWLLLYACASPNEELTSTHQWNAEGVPVDATAQAQRDLFVGRWYDRQNARDGSQTMSLMDVNLDGTYFESWRTLEKDGSLAFSEEKGRWGVSGNIFFTIVTARTENGTLMVDVDQRNAYFYDAYIVEKADKDSNTIRHVVAGDEFVSRRVDADFSFPAFALSK
ncbi:MAG: hypothetical protein PCALPYG88_7007 [uncultured Paraburkholderia sp.]|uniref:hypothetical protein n=1 Tax=uncultured Paraburkholderia sp. TaxID=1822466 RepID=UPI002599A78D|nr:hypothetical protein [uncultured Paraburkholderia sp.]CAH2903832.1 MAG: hypothetical protein PCALPYG08_7014 [uncultured Paraburkholderia sp.]CAH2941569.1 MAG: hypothetical protein PCALPYG88_7007 [uncultured Paraburkholderia sp.]